eukprot:5289530-Amphidinium_carterae.2
MATPPNVPTLAGTAGSPLLDHLKPDHVWRQHFIPPRRQLPGHRAPRGAIGRGDAPCGFPWAYRLLGVVVASPSSQDGLQGSRSMLSMRQVVVDAQQERTDVTLGRIRWYWTSPEEPVDILCFSQGSSYQ